MNNKQFPMLTKVTFFILLYLIVGCKSSHNCLIPNHKTIDSIEIEINDLKIPLDENLINSFIKEFNKSRKNSTNKRIVHVLDLIIYAKSGEVYRFKSNGNNFFIYKNQIFINKENLILKYWGINEENIPFIKAPLPK